MPLLNTTGYSNTASGVRALYQNTEGFYNTASGFRSLFSNHTGNYNTASGVNALWANSTGGYNTASGFEALYFNNGNENTASGTVPFITIRRATLIPPASARSTRTEGFITPPVASGRSPTIRALQHRQRCQCPLGESTGAETPPTLHALYSNTTGSNNIALGYVAGATSQSEATTLTLEIQESLGKATPSVSA